MTAKDQYKLLKAGFTIIRADQHTPGNYRIKFKDASNTEWKTKEDGFMSAAALRRRMDFLLSDLKIVED